MSAVPRLPFVQVLDSDGDGQPDEWLLADRATFDDAFGEEGAAAGA